MKKALSFAISLLLLSAAFSAGAEDDLRLTIKTDKAKYQMGAEIKIDFVITNQSKENQQIYFLNTHEPERYLIMKTSSGEPIEGQETAIYKWENPSFHLLGPGESLEKKFKGTITIKPRALDDKSKDKTPSIYLEFSDVAFDLGDVNKIRLQGVFDCNVQTASDYRERFKDNVQKDFWIGNVKSVGVEIEIE